MQKMSLDRNATLKHRSLKIIPDELTLNAVDVIKNTSNHEDRYEWFSVFVILVFTPLKYRRHQVDLLWNFEFGVESRGS